MCDQEAITAIFLFFGGLMIPRRPSPPCPSPPPPTVETTNVGRGRAQEEWMGDAGGAGESGPGAEGVGDRFSTVRALGGILSQ